LAEFNISSTNTKECAMKNLLFTVFSFSVLLLIGCQENSMVDPLSPDSINKSGNPTSNITSGTIKLGGLLVLPGGFQSYYTIDGQIDYTHEKVLVDPIPPAPQYYIAVGLSIRAEISDGSNILTVSSNSNDNVYVSEEGIMILEKVYPVLNSENGLVLICKFLVTTDGLGLNEMMLEEGYVNPNLNKSKEPTPFTMPPFFNNQSN
jgi:hypothetical protein